MKPLLAPALSLALTLLAVLPAAPSRAAGPTDVVRATSDKIVAQVRRPEMQGDAQKKARQRLVRDAMEGHFAWELSSQACLGKHWPKRTPEEKAEFVKIFSAFLKDTYSEKIATYYGELKEIKYVGEKIIDDSAQVKVTIFTTKGTDHPVEYRMRNIGGQWLVYDVLIEGVSLVKNYRDQFDALLAKGSWESLMDDLRAKQKKVAL